MHTLMFYTRQGCNLCNEALGVVARAIEVVPFHLEVIDIDEDPELQRRYLFDVPVIMLNGREIGRHRIQKEAIIEAVNKI